MEAREEDPLMDEAVRLRALAWQLLDAADGLVEARARLAELAKTRSRATEEVKEEAERCTRAMLEGLLKPFFGFVESAAWMLAKLLAAAMAEELSRKRELGREEVAVR
jgi:hypothetical protein